MFRSSNILYFLQGISCAPYADKSLNRLHVESVIYNTLSLQFILFFGYTLVMNKSNFKSVANT